MIYLMTDVIRYEFSGIDYAIRQRYRLFKEMGVPVKIISTIYNRFSDLNRFRAGIAAEDCINMNDFFSKPFFIMARGGRWLILILVI